MPFTFGEDPFNTGDSTGVSCMIVKGDLPIHIKWTLNNEPIVSGENGITINKLSAKSSVMNIAAVEREHRGIIKCIAENLAGSDIFASELTVNGTANVAYRIVDIQRIQSRSLPEISFSSISPQLSTIPHYSAPAEL